MSDCKNVIDKETKKFLEYAEKLGELELNFRTYISEKGLSENSYSLAAKEYSDNVAVLKKQIEEAKVEIEDIEANNYVASDTLQELNVKLGRIWRIIIANETFVNEYGGVNFTDETQENSYKKIYEKHLQELKEFMYFFITTANILFSK